jgi:hypothetical protein
MDRQLDRLLWRCEFGGAAPEMLALEMRDRLQRLRDDSVDVRDSQTVRLWDDALLVEYDGAFHGAARLLDLGKPRPALKQIHGCEQVIASMRALVQASNDADAAAAAMEQIHDLAGTGRLRSLPSVASLAQIVDLVRQGISERRYTQASHMARICVRLAEALRERRLIPVEERAAFEQRIDTIRDLCAATEPFVDAVNDEPTRDGTLAALRSLFVRQYVVLGSRLLSELEVQFAGRRRFLLYVQRTQLGGTAAFAAADEVRTLVRERSWDGAVDHYWHLSIASHAGAIEQQRRRAEAADAALTLAIAPQEASHD